jgi:peptidoglycan/xylan/chitin deacetylase (PgdA/CDA1 family)
MTHPILTEEKEARARHEVAESRRVIGGWIGEPVRHFAYPNGNASDVTEILTRRAGYETAWTTVPLWVRARQNEHRLPRVQIFGHHDPGEVILKIVLAMMGLLRNPDGTGMAYRLEAARRYREHEPTG